MRKTIVNQPVGSIIIRGTPTSQIAKTAVIVLFRSTLTSTSLSLTDPQEHWDEQVKQVHLEGVFLYCRAFYPVAQ